MVVMLLGGAAACGQGQSTTPDPLAQTASATMPPTATVTLEETLQLVTVEPTFTPSPTIAPLPTADCLSRSGTLEDTTLTTAHIAYPLRFKVYLPPCYAEWSGQRFPVLYLFHGMMADETQWLSLGLPETMDRLIGRKDIAPFIVVMTFDPSWNEPSEYHFHDAITEDLVPFIDGQYRTIPDRSARAVGGVSRGSGWAFHLGLTRPDLFGTIGAHSMVVFSSDWMLIKGWLASIPRQDLPRLYIDISVNDSALWTAKQLEIALNDASIPHEFHLNNGYHDEQYWSAHIEDYLRWYAAGWTSSLEDAGTENP